MRSSIRSWYWRFAMFTGIDSSFEESSGAFWSARFLWPLIRCLIGLLDVFSRPAVEALLLACKLGLANVGCGHRVVESLSALFGVDDTWLRLAVSEDVLALAAVSVVAVGV